MGTINLMSNYSPSSKETGFAHVLVLLVALAAASLIASSTIQTTNTVQTTKVLGEDTQADEQTQEAAKHAAEQQQEALKTQSEGQKQETEVETANGQKIKTKVEDNGAVKVEIEQGKSKFKYQSENGKVQLEAEDEAKVENELEQEGIKVSSSSGNLVIAKNKFAAKINFPLSVDPNTKQLIVTTPAGQKAVTILPDQAVQNLLTRSILSEIGNQEVSADLTNKLGSLDGVVQLESKDNEVVYKVDGLKTRKLLGLIPVTVPATAYVSAQTGSVTSLNQSVLANLLDLLSR